MLLKNVPLTARTLLLAGAFLAMTAEAQAGPIQVSVNGESVRFGKVGPLRKGGRVLVPLRSVLLSIGARVKYNPSKRRISATNGRTNVILGLGQRLAIVNNEEFVLDTPARMIEGTAMVPLRFITESFGAKVDWDADSGKIDIRTDR
jgi:hypothetical protein